MSGQRWLALESNPQSFNQWSQSLGLDTTKFSFQDVYGLDPEVLSWAKQPVKAVILLFPVTEAYEAKRLAQDEKIAQEGVENVEDVIYFKQTIANACGTFGLLHALANCGVPLAEGPLTELFRKAVDKSPLERAQLLETSDELAQTHEASANTGQTETPALDAVVELHFATFVEHKGNLIELDGRRNSPVNHGKIEKGLLEDTAEIVKGIIALSDRHDFNLITLGPTPADDE